MTKKSLVDRVWDKAKKIRGENPNFVRKDPYGNRIRKSHFGRDTPEGWEVDHIKPQSKGGSDHIRNLQAMQTAKNRELGDSWRKRSRHKQR